MTTALLLPRWHIDDLIDLTLYRLGDSEQRIWSRDEAEKFLLRGYDLLCLEARLIWDQAYLPDVAGQAVYRVPDDLLVIERASWNNKRLQPIAPTEMQRWDYNYQDTRGPVYAYLFEKDGLRNLRKVRVPDRDYDPLPIDDGNRRPVGWGIARLLTDITTEVPSSNWGIPRRVPGYRPIYGPFGLPRRFEVEQLNVRVEFFRRPQNPRSYLNGLMSEVPIHYVKYTLWYAQWQMLLRDGPGQDAEMALHFKQRWEAGVARALSRHIRSERMTTFRLGGDLRPLPRPPRPVMPWQFGEEVDP